MKILQTNQVKEADAYTIKNEPISSIDLMERAATNLTKWILDKFLVENEFVIFAGVGNNGGDGLVVARLLSEKLKKVKVFIVEFSKKYSEDFNVNLNRLIKTNIDVIHLTQEDKFPQINVSAVIIDAIFGSGLTRPVNGFAANIIEKINFLNNKVVAIDIPSGLFGEENHHIADQKIIQADYTLTFEFPFLSFVLPENENFVGEFSIIPIGISQEFIDKANTDYFFIEFDDIAKLLKHRKKFSHKGNYGHGLLIAGGYGRMGASVLSAKAAHRSGIGLLTAHVPKKCVDIMQISSPETMISIDNDKKSVTEIENINKYNAIAIGPAIGFDKKTIKFVKQLFSENKEKSFVIDADAITIISKNNDIREKIPKKSILTPHPKEFLRLIGKTKNNFIRLQLQREFSLKYNVILVLKGAHSSISCPDGKVYFNSTGNPGMATGGSGDVLTGIILSLLAQNYKPEDAAKIAVFFHGLSADIAAAEIGQMSLIASDIVDYLGAILPTEN